MPAIELAVLDAICSGLVSYALRVFLLLRQSALKQVCLEHLSPEPLLRLEREEETGSRGRATSWGA